MNNSKFKISLQKSLVVLVVAMLLAIPNMRVYSFIGSYQTSSQAIKANNKYELQNRVIEKPIFPVYALYGLGLLGGLGSIAAGVFQAIAMVKGVQAAKAAKAAMEEQQMLQEATGVGSFSISNYKNHVAHDFSKFDN